MYSRTVWWTSIPIGLTISIIEAMIEHNILVSRSVMCNVQLQYST